MEYIFAIFVVAVIAAVIWHQSNKKPSMHVDVDEGRATVSKSDDTITNRKA